MNRRRFFAALFALPFAGKALEALAAAAPPTLREWSGVVRFRSSLAMSREFVEGAMVPQLDVMIAETADSVRRSIEDMFLNGDEMVNCRCVPGPVYLDDDDDADACEGLWESDEEERHG